MKKTHNNYGLALAMLVAFLKALEYRYFVRSLSLEVYMGALATIFTFRGVWLGLKLTQKPQAELQTSPELMNKYFQHSINEVKASGASAAEINARIGKWKSTAKCIKTRR